MDAGSALTLLLLGLVLAAAPWSVLASLLLVTSADGVRKDVAFVAGWVAALAVVAAVTVAAAPVVPSTTTSGVGHAWLEVALGAALGAVAIRGVVRRRRVAAPARAGSASGWGDGASVSGAASGDTPVWLARLDRAGVVSSFALGAFLPTYTAVVAAVSELLASGLSRAGLALVALGWVVLASAGVAAPLAVRVVAADRAEDVYGRWRGWILDHHTAVAGVALGVVSVVLVAKGVTALA